MKAVVCEAYGGPETLVIKEVPDPEPAESQVVLDVEVASFNYPDLLTIRGLYQIKTEPPFSPGSEAVGTVKKVGVGVRWPRVGDRVAAVGVAGAFAEQWVVDPARCVAVPESVPSDVAAATVFAYGTSLHALKQRAELQPGESLLVLGAAGGVGSAAVEIGTMMGATVIAAASSDAKLAFCRDLGAVHTINYTTENLRQRVKDISDGRGVDVIYDPVGGAFSETAFRSVAWKGRHLVVGFTAGEIPKVPWNLALLKGASIVGVFWGAFAEHEPEANRENLAALMGHITAGDLTPRVTARFSLENFLRAYDLVTHRKALGKVVLEIGS
jgi:NADPH2:quinone reductase